MRRLPAVAALLLLPSLAWAQTPPPGQPAHTAQGAEMASDDVRRFPADTGSPYKMAPAR